MLRWQILQINGNQAESPATRTLRSFTLPFVAVLPLGGTTDEDTDGSPKDVVGKPYDVCFRYQEYNQPGTRKAVAGGRLRIGRR